MRLESQKWRYALVELALWLSVLQSDDTEEDLTRTWKYLDVGKDGILLCHRRFGSDHSRLVRVHE